ncbi:uncharacterized protein [Miscanthus floridulus]|uniref:uncharacterized protein n=1 Tax=Miscanthus floridulus TaxID=154761 RepID=UPI00345A2E03
MDASLDSKMEMEMVPDYKMKIAPDSEEVVADDVVPDSEEVAADDVGLDSEEVAADSVDLLLSMEGLDSVDPLQSIEDSMESAMLSSEMEEVADSMAADSKVVAPESEEVVAPESEEIVAPESEEIVAPNSLPSGAFICRRCQALSMLSLRISSTADYLIFAVIHGFYEFECEFFIPDVDNIVFDGDQIVLPLDVLKTVEEEAKERRKRKLTAKKAMEDAKAAQE